MNYQSLPPLSLQDAEDDRQATREWHTLSAYITDGPCREWRLIYLAEDMPVRKNATAFDFRGHAAVITGGRAPHKPSSTGKVWTSDEGEYYPGVFGMKWVLVSE
jgi:hypothetical protein